MICDDFEVAAGSIVGRDHLRPFGWRNNQDSFAIRVAEDAIVAVVADGCGSESKSEVGAVIGAEIVAESVLLHSLLLNVGERFSTVFCAVREQVLGKLVPIAASMGPDFRKIIYDHFLFTVNGVLIARNKSALFAIGDGVQFVNGESIPLGSFANNAPPYLAYTTLTSWGDPDPANNFVVTKLIPTSDINSVLIGTDGVGHLVAAERELLPGKSEFVGPVSQFWQDDRYFANPDMMRRRLALMQYEHLAVDWQDRTILRTPGKLPDDTTLVAIRRKPKRS